MIILRGGCDSLVDHLLLFFVDRRSKQLPTQILQQANGALASATIFTAAGLAVH